MNRAAYLTLAALVTALGLAAAPAAVAQGPTAESAEIRSPRNDALVTGRTLKVRVRLARGTTQFRAWLDGTRITRRFRRGGSRLRVARVPIRKLAAGRHYIRVKATRRGERRFYHAAFIRGRRKVDLVRRVPVPKRAVPTAGAGTKPLALRLTKRGVAVAADRRGHRPILRIRVNGRAVASRLPAGRGRLATVLSADEGLRRGRNVVTIQAYLKDGRYDLEKRVVDVPRGVPLAAAGRARATFERGAVRLSGRSSLASSARARLRYRWRIVKRPRGSRARLRAARSATPSVATDLHGAYLVALTVSERRGGRLRRSTDLVAVAVRPNFPPMGVPLDTMATKDGVRGIQVGDDFYPTQPAADKAHVLVLDRLSLQKETFVALPGDATIDTALDELLSPYVADLRDHLVVLTGPAGCCKGSAILPAQAFSYVLPLEAGTADIGKRGASNAGLDLDGSHPAGHLDGFLQYQGNVSPYSFVQTDNFAFDTRSSLTTRIPAPEVMPQGGRIYLLASKLGTVLDVPQASTVKGEQMVANPETRQLSQQWALSNDQPYAPHFLLGNVNSGLCLTVRDASKAAYAEIVQAQCNYANPGAGQLWDPVRRSGGRIALKNVFSGMVLTVQDDSPKAATPVVQAPDAGADGQLWQFEEQLPKPRNGVFTVVSRLGTALSLAPTGNQLAAETEAVALDQQWLAVSDPHERTHYQLRNTANGLCADVLGSSTASGAAIVQASCDGSFQKKSQLWHHDDIAPDVRAVINVNSGLALSVQGDSSDSGTPVVQADQKWSQGQRWFFRERPPAPRPQGVYVIASKLGTVLEPADGSNENGRPIAARERTDLPSQRWRLFPDPEAPGKFQIIDNASGLCLDVTGASRSPGAEVAQWPCDSGHEQSNQIWTPERQPGGSYALVNVESGLSLTVQDGSKDSGTAVVQEPNTGADGQQWLFEPIEAAPQAQGVFVVASTLGPAIDLGSGSTPRNRPVIAADQRDQQSQQWLFRPAGNPGQQGSFALVNLTTGLCLESPDKTDGGQVRQDDCGPNLDSDGQLWTPVQRQDASGYSLKNRFSGLALTLQGGSIVQSQDVGTDAQTWSLRPLARTLTATVGETEYSVPVPFSWSGFAVMPFDAATRPKADPALFLSYVNTTNRDLDRLEQTVLAEELSAWAKAAGTTVLVQSVGSPRPTSRSWGDIGKAIGGLGGNEQVFDQLDGSGEYGFVGCEGCTEMPEASFPLTRDADADSLTGTLSRNSSSTLEPRIAFPMDAATPSLTNLAYQPASPWPVPASDGQRAALSNIARQMGLTGAACYAPAQPDVRSSYCDESIDFGARLQKLHDLVAPDDASRGFTDEEFALVKDSLADEFMWVSDIRRMIANLQKPFGTADVGGTVDFTGIGQKIKDSLATDGRKAEANGWTVVPTILDAVSLFFGEAAPEIEIGLGVLAASLDIGEELAEQPDGEPALGEFTAKTEQLGSELHDRYRAASESLDFVGYLLVTDFAKLRTAALAVAGQDPARNWQICDLAGCGLSPKDMDDSLALGGRQWLWTHMLPAAFDLFEFAPPAGKHVGDITCVLNPNSIPIKYSHPFQSAPENTTYDVVTGFDDSGAAQRSRVRVLARGDFGKLAEEIRFPSSEIADQLFRPARQGGVGLFQPTLFTDPDFTIANWTQLPHGDDEIGQNRCDWQKPR